MSKQRHPRHWPSSQSWILEYIAALNRIKNIIRKAREKLGVHGALAALGHVKVKTRCKRYMGMGLTFVIDPEGLLCV